MRAPFAVLLPLFIVAGCSAEPPRKELDRAQGAIDAARAAGAETYAPEAFAAATSALQQAHDAVAQRDHRLALTQALDAHDRAQEAARGAADGKARARSEAEAAITAADTALRRLHSRITAEGTRLPKRDLQEARQVHNEGEATLQKARASHSVGSYLDARATAKDLSERITEELEELDAAAAAKPSRPTRRRR